MLITELGIIILLSPLQPSNIDFIILVTESGIVTLVSPIQSRNADSPMLVTLFGIIMLERSLHYRNAFALILVIEFPKLTSVAAVIFSILSAESVPTILNVEMLSSLYLTIVSGRYTVESASIFLNPFYAAVSKT